MSGPSNPKRQKSRGLVRLQVENIEYTVDEDDYNLIEAMPSHRNWGWDEAEEIMTFNLDTSTSFLCLSYLRSEARLSICFDLDDEKRVSRLEIKIDNIDLFPEEVWRLSALKTLLVYVGSGMISSIERLQNLEQLHLVFTGTGPTPSEFSDQLEHIGKLRKLRTLCVSSYNHGPRVQRSNLKFLENLEHLEYLGLTIEISQFFKPTLELIRKLKNLKYLHIFPRGIEAETHELMLGLVQASNIVGVDRELELGYPKLTHALACNCFKYRTPFRCAADELFPILNKLWPRMLSNATRAFGRFYPVGYRDNPVLNIKTHDAVYKLLLDGRGSFAQVLVRRSSSSNNK